MYPAPCTLYPNRTAERRNARHPDPSAAHLGAKRHLGNLHRYFHTAHPYMEYGMLQGTVNAVSLIANEKIYVVDVELEQGLITGTGKILTFTGELTGEAEIITDDRSLANRILAPIAYLLKHFL